MLPSFPLCSWFLRSPPRGEASGPRNQSNCDSTTVRQSDDGPLPPCGAETRPSRFCAAGFRSSLPAGGTILKIVRVRTLACRLEFALLAIGLIRLPTGVYIHSVLLRDDVDPAFIHCASKLFPLWSWFPRSPPREDRASVTAFFKPRAQAL